MRKTVLAFFVKMLFCLSASAQTHADSAQTAAKPIKFSTRDSALQKPVFILPVLPADYYATHLPFFCSTELKLQKALKFPVKFRLGSVEACDKLEGKHQR